MFLDARILGVLFFMRHLPTASCVTSQFEWAAHGRLCRAFFFTQFVLLFKTWLINEGCSLSQPPDWLCLSLTIGEMRISSEQYFLSYFIFICYIFLLYSLLYYFMNFFPPINVPLQLYLFNLYRYLLTKANRSAVHAGQSPVTTVKLP